MQISLAQTALSWERAYLATQGHQKNSNLDDMLAWE